MTQMIHKPTSVNIKLHFRHYSQAIYLVFKIGLYKSPEISKSYLHIRIRNLIFTNKIHIKYFYFNGGNEKILSSLQGR